jgi:homocysteine S-methyltransferase
LAVRLHNEVPGITVPEAVLERLRRAGAAAEEEGMALGRELLAGARERVAGAYLIPPFKQPEAVLGMLADARAGAPAR